MSFHPDMDLFGEGEPEFEALEEEVFPSQSDLPDGEFIFLAHAGSKHALFLEFLDVSDSLVDWLEEEVDNLGPILDDIGLRSNLEGIEGVVKVHCRYLSWTEQTMDGTEYETAWEEIKHEEMRIVRLPWWRRLEEYFKWRRTTKS